MDDIQKAFKKATDDKFKYIDLNRRLQKTNRSLKRKLSKAEVALLASMQTFDKLSASEDEGVSHVASAGLSLVKGILEDIGNYLNIKVE